MKVILRVIVLFMLTASIISCDDNDTTTPVVLTPSYANFYGTWKLVSWNNKTVTDGLYCYITFDRKEHTYKMYQKFDSMYARYITGTYTIEKDKYNVYTVSGTYDYDNGDWNNVYIVTDLLETGTMTWTAEDNKSDVCRYERCDAVPSEIIDEARIWDEE